MQEQKGEGGTRGHFEEKVDRKSEIEEEQKIRGGGTTYRRTKNKNRKSKKF